MNTRTPQMTAIIRGAYMAAGTFALSFLSLWMVVGVQAAATAGGIAALGALGFRSLEGAHDARSGAQRAADVHKANEDSPGPHIVKDV